MTKEKLEKISKLMLWVIPGMLLCMIGDFTHSNVGWDCNNRSNRHYC